LSAMVVGMACCLVVSCGDEECHCLLWSSAMVTLVLVSAHGDASASSSGGRQLPLPHRCHCHCQQQWILIEHSSMFMKGY
jgi:hypothetical protein